MEEKDTGNHETIIIEERITKVNGDFHIKRYARGKLLGRGGFAKVYNFTNLETNKVMAGKVMPKVNLNRSRSRQKLMVEIRLHKSLHHPNIVKFEHVFEDHENVYILLELCQHQSMSELLKRRKRLTEFEVQCYTIQIVDSLKYLHANRIIHRDLKLGNLFLSDKMQVKLGDFGLAAKLEFDGEKKRTVCGTPNYIAPEILDGNIGHSYEVDIWSLGVIILNTGSYTLIVGKPPFETNDIKVTYKKIKDVDFTFPDNMSVSQNAKDLIIKILQGPPEKRLSLDEILQHPFINNGSLVPKLMPISTLACPPTSAYMKQFASTSTSQRIRISTEPDTNDNEGLKSTRAQTSRFPPMLKSPTSSDAPTIDLFRMTPKTPKIELLGSERFNPLAVLAHDKGRLAVPQTPKTPKTKGNLFINYDIPEEQEDEAHKKLEEKKNGGDKSPKKSETKKPEVISELRVIKFYDYSAKYGLGYALSNGAVGVCFNDGTKLIATPDEQTFDIIVRSTNKEETSKTYMFKEYPQELHKNVLVYKKFRENFDMAIKSISPNQQKQETSVYIKKWIKTKHATFFRMNNRVLQVWFKDDSILIINSDTKKLTFVDTKEHIIIYPLEIASSSDNKELTKRLKYTEDVLRQIWTAQTEGGNERLGTQEGDTETNKIDLNKNIVIGNPTEVETEFTSSRATTTSE